MIRLAVVSLVFAFLPIFIMLLRQAPRYRPLALTLLGAMLFLSDDVQLNGWMIGWPLWKGFVRGIAVSPVDMMALALIMTRRRLPGRLPFWAPLLFYGAALSLSLFAASVPLATVFACWQFARMLLLFGAVGGEVHRPEMRTGLLNGLALGLILQAGFVVNQKLHGVVQAPGLMPHQNILGLMTELAMLPLLAGLLAGARRPLWMIGIASGLLIVAGGGSRASVGITLGGMMILTLLSVVRRATPTKMRIVGFAFLGLAVTAPLALMTLKDRFGQSSILTQEQQRARFEAAARSMAADHPFGIGANLFVVVSNTQGYAAKAGVAWNEDTRAAPVHNSYLLARAETGWLGEFALIVMLGTPLAFGLRHAFVHRNRIDGEVALGSAVSIATNMLHIKFEYAFFTYHVLALATMNMALIAAQIRAARSALSRRPSPPPSLVGRQTARLAGVGASGPAFD